MPWVGLFNALSREQLRPNTKCRKLGFLSFVMEPTEVCPQGFHFTCRDSIDGTGRNLVPTPRCQCQVQYYIMDFETSQQFVGGRHNALRRIRDTPSQFLPAPELSKENADSETSYNPFCLDVYNIRKTFHLICDVSVFCRSNSSVLTSLGLFRTIGRSTTICGLVDGEETFGPADVGKGYD